MNILICAAFYTPHIGGYEKNIEALAKRLVKEGHTVDILTCNTEKEVEYEGLGKYTIIRLPCWNLLDGTYPVPTISGRTYQMLKGAVRYSHDVIITQTRFFTTSLLGLILAWIKRIPLVHVERGTCHSVVQDAVVRFICKVYDHTIGCLISRYAVSNIGVSKAACDFIKHYSGRDAVVVHNGIDIRDYRTEIRRTKEIYITFVGRLIYAKGVQDLIKAFVMCNVLSSKELKLRIVGEGNYRKQLEDLAYHSGGFLDIKFYGQRNDVIDILEESDIFVNPSYSEGLPTSVMEAASVGLPIIATDVGGTNEIIKHMKSGILIKPHDVDSLEQAIKVMIDDPVGARKMAAMARNTIAARFSWDQIVKQYIGLLEGIVNKK